jgi:gag-polypeptide of LTR copia-type
MIKAIFLLHLLDEIILGKEAKPLVTSTPTAKEAKALANWTKWSKQATSLIVLSIKDMFYHLITNLSDGKEMWDTLSKNYEKPGALTAFLLYQKLFRLTLSEGSPLYKQIQELMNLRQQVSTARVSITDQHFAFSILQLLPNSYSTSSLMILALIKLIDVISRILEES